jgi:hypothetical protein
MVGLFENDGMVGLFENDAIGGDLSTILMLAQEEAAETSRAICWKDAATRTVTRTTTDMSRTIDDFI